jgi:hypothetical protein
MSFGILLAVPTPGRVRLLRVMPAASPRVHSTSRLWSFQSLRSLAARTWAGHRLFVIVLIPAVLLRVDAELGYRWQVWFNDSFDYIQNTVHFQLDTTRVSGYSIWLKVLEPFHSYAIVTILQHLMGIAVAVMVYALARHRFGAPAWLATLAAVPVLYDGFQIQLEHLIMADVPFLFVAMLALTLLLWNPGKPSLLRCAVIGLLLGIADVVRSVALPLLIVFAIYLLLCRIGWRRVLALVVMCLLPLVAYMGLFDAEHGNFAMNDSDGVFLYSRVMTFAECSKMSLPLHSPLNALCTTVPPDQRPIAQAYIWTSMSPLDRFPPSKFSPVPDGYAEKFAIKAIETQPLGYAKAVLDDTWRVFGFKREVFPNPATYDEYLFSRHPLGIPSYNLASLGRYKSYAAAYNESDPYTHVVQPFAAIMETYEKHVYLPGTIYGLILLIGLGGMVLAWRRLGGDAMLPWAISVTLVVFPAATAEFDYRYVLPAVPFACLAVVMAFAPGTPGGIWIRRLAARIGRKPGVVPSRKVSAGAPHAADAGDDERNFAADGV